MPNGDKMKAVFLPNSKLRQKLATRVQTARQDITTGVQLANTLPQGDPVKLELLADAVHLASAIREQEQEGGDNPGAAYCAMQSVCVDAAAFAQDAPQRVQAQQDVVKKATMRQAGSDFDRRAAEIGQRLEAARKARWMIANQTEAAKIGARIAALDKDLGQLATTARGAPEGIETHAADTTAVLRNADALLADARKAQALPPEDGTPRKASREVTDAVGGIKGMSEKMASTQRDARGRTVAEDAAARLEVFDERFAADETADPKARATNKAMRLASIVGATAAKSAKDVNDPHLEGRIGQLTVREFGPDLAQALTKGKPGDKAEREATAQALRIAQALLMDDPVGKIMTGKIRPEDAVQRIRDQADIAGLKPSEMMKLLRQQFEMKLGSLSGAELQQGELDRDQNKDGETQNFVLKDLQGELSPEQAKGMVPFDQRARRELGPEATTPSGRNDGLALQPMGKQVHVGAKGETLRDLAARYLGDASRASEIFEDNKQALAAVLQKTPQGQEPDLSGVRLKVNVEHSVLDEIARQVDAWDTTAPNQPDAAKAKAPRAPGNPDKVVTRGKLPTAEALQAGAAKLKSPGETPRPGLPGYVPAPGLAQDHKVRKPLEGDGEKAPDIKGDGKGEPKKSTGALNERQYAHLRLLQRADEEDKEAFKQENGKSVEDFVIDKIVERHSIAKDKAQQLVADAAAWFGEVPLTITFKAASLFSDPAKDAPAHGAVYKSEVEYSRTQKPAADLIGRDDNVKIKEPPEKLDKKGKPKQDEEREKEAQKLGVTGGDKGNWTKERGANYMRWRRDKDAREGRLDELAYEDQQIFGAVNPNFDTMHATDGDEHGTNYYGDAHFLLADGVRSRAAFAIRGGGISVGGGKSAVQRTDLMMMLHDMIKGGEKNMKYMDALLLNAKGSPTVVMTKLDWEVHLYGGFDIRTDAKEMWLSPNLEKDLKDRIERFAKTNSLACQFYASEPTGIRVINSGAPEKLTLEFS